LSSTLASSVLPIPRSPRRVFRLAIERSGFVARLNAAWPFGGMRLVRT
jgi:hypothetical protein